jgi:hypothetical protein
MFEDDKDFFQETFSFVKQGNKNLKFQSEKNVKIEEKNESQKFMLNIGTGSIVPVDSKIADIEMKILIHEAKDFLKMELAKHSVLEKDMPHTLKGLVSLASTKGISIKDVKFSPETVKKIAKNNNSKEPIFEFGKGIIEEKRKNSNQKIKSTISTTSFLENRQNLQKQKITSSTKINNQNIITTNLTTSNKFSSSLSSVLQNVGEVAVQSKITENPRETKTLKQDVIKQNSLSGLLQSDDFVSLKEQNSELSKIAIKGDKQSKIVQNISQKMNISPELLLEIFSEDELIELDGGNSKLKIGDNEIEHKSESTTINQDIKIKHDLDFKISTAKTTMKSIISDLKELMENYKPPVTKLSLTLNPKNMGEVDVTLIQRGNNMHINIGGNTTAVNLLSQNSNELRNQLIDAGLSNHTFNFNGGGKNGENSRREEERVKDIQKSNNQNDEEFATSLDIVISEYA